MNPSEPTKHAKAAPPATEAKDRMRPSPNAGTQDPRVRVSKTRARNHAPSFAWG